MIHEGTLAERDIWKSKALFLKVEILIITNKAKKIKSRPQLFAQLIGFLKKNHHVAKIPLSS